MQQTQYARFSAQVVAQRGQYFVGFDFGLIVFDGISQTCNPDLAGPWGTGTPFVTGERD
jgi:hypothetical protein